MHTEAEQFSKIEPPDFHAQALIKQPFPDVSKAAERAHAFLCSMRTQGFLDEATDEAFALLHEAARKRYGLIWESQPEKGVRVPGLLPVLQRDPASGCLDYPHASTHVLIEGDNLPILRVLDYTHSGEIDLIYIDPPYNTGRRDFQYNDRFVCEEDGYRHSKWLSFMSRRLRLARSLLKPTGSIFISIDENEFAQLKLLCDEIFGEENLVAPAVWLSRGGKNDSSHLKLKHEFILVYARDIKQLRFNKKPSEAGSYRLTDSDGRRYAECGFDRQGLNYSAALDYPIEAPDGSLIYPGQSKAAYDLRQAGEAKIRDWRWTLSRTEFERRLKADEITFRKTKGAWRVYYKSYHEGKETAFDAVFDDIKADTVIKDIFGSRIFDFAKPVALIRRIIEIACPKDGTVLDFFAGSGTTGHAVMQANVADGGQRRAIMVTNNEGGICRSVTLPRLMAVIKGYEPSCGKRSPEPGLEQNLVLLELAMHPTPRSQETLRAFMRASEAAYCLRSGCFFLQTQAEVDEDCRIFVDPSCKKRMIIVYDELLTDTLDSHQYHVMYHFSYEQDDKSSSANAEACPTPLIRAIQQ